MGSTDSAIYDLQGKQVTDRKCIILVTPPTFQISKLVEELSSSFPYQYISIGQMIRDEINKKTNYSKIILQNLQKYKKINDKILDILLKNAALQGNFMIKFSPKDQDELAVWKQFMSKVQIQLIAIFRVQVDQISASRPSYKQKYRQYEQDIKNVKNEFQKKLIVEIEGNQNAKGYLIQALSSTTH